MAATASALRSRAATAARDETSEPSFADVASIQRARILTAMFDVVGERGVTKVSVADVVERSGVSRRTFYELFDDRESCFLAAFDEALASVRGRVLTAAAGERCWSARLRAGLVALLSFLEERPAAGRLLVVESLYSGGEAHRRRERVLASVVRTIDEGRREPGAASPPPLTAEGLAGGVLTLLQARLGRSGDEPLPALASELMSMIVLPYLGASAARRELERPTPVRAGERQRESSPGDPFKAAGMRLTYRTARVLLAVAEHPGASNRLLGELAGVTDQGQASKLLSRLRRIGLIANDGLAPGQGAPNAWSLTASGRQLAKSIRTHTESAN